MKVSLEEKIKNVSVKHQIDAHQSFLLSLYGSTREDELTMSSLNELEKRAFIKQQFRLKEDDYKRKFFDAEFLILYRKKKPIGRVVYRISDSIHLIEPSEQVHLQNFV